MHNSHFFSKNKGFLFHTSNLILSSFDFRRSKKRVPANSAAPPTTPPTIAPIGIEADGAADPVDPASGVIAAAVVPEPPEAGVIAEVVGPEPPVISDINKTRNYVLHH